MKILKNPPPRIPSRCLRDAFETPSEQTVRKKESPFLSCLPPHSSLKTSNFKH